MGRHSSPMRGVHCLQDGKRPIFIERRRWRGGRGGHNGVPPSVRRAKQVRGKDGAGVHCLFAPLLCGLSFTIHPHTLPTRGRPEVIMAKVAARSKTMAKIPLLDTLLLIQDGEVFRAVAEESRRTSEGRTKLTVSLLEVFVFYRPNPRGEKGLGSLHWSRSGLPYAPTTHPLHVAQHRAPTIHIHTLPNDPRP